MMTISPSLRVSVAFAAAALLVTGPRPSLEARTFAGAPAGEKKPPAAAPRAPVWPLPPEQPRIRYVATYHGIEDFHPKQKSAWKSLFFGEDGTRRPDSDSLVKPYGVAVSGSGRIYVTDTAARRVFVFDIERKTVTYLGEQGAAKLTKPIGVAVDSEGRVFVADGTLNRVFGYGPDGNMVMAIGRDGDFDSPSGLAADATHKRLYVADARKHQVLCYSTEDGSPIATIGRRGGEPGEFNYPTNLFVDAEGRLFVSDTLNFRIQIFDAAGKFLSTFGTLGDSPGTFNRPKGVGVDREGHIYVADSSFSNFQIFDAGGQLLLHVGTAGHGLGEFFLPAGLCIDGRDRIYVADQGNARIQVFQYLRAASK
jgi:DNA-binding beta-propeller fold protein YncE